MQDGLQMQGPAEVWVIPPGLQTNNGQIWKPGECELLYSCNSTISIPLSNTITIKAKVTKILSTLPTQGFSSLLRTQMSLSIWWELCCTHLHDILGGFWIPETYPAPHLTANAPLNSVHSLTPSGSVERNGVILLWWLKPKSKWRKWVVGGEILSFTQKSV